MIALTQSPSQGVEEYASVAVKLASDTNGSVALSVNGKHLVIDHDDDPNEVARKLSRPA
jgi:hypothetical protein